MGFAERSSIARLLMEKGWLAGTPAAIITNASQDDRQGIWTGPLSALGDALLSASPEDAHTLVVGEVVSVGAVIARAMSQARPSHRVAGADRGAGAPRATA